MRRGTQPEQTRREGPCGLSRKPRESCQISNGGGVTSSLSLELKKRGIGGLPHQATQLRGADLHSLPEKGGGSAGHTARKPRPEPLPGARAPGRSAAPLPLYHGEAQHFSVVLPHQGGHWGRCVGVDAKRGCAQMQVPRGSGRCEWKLLQKRGRGEGGGGAVRPWSPRGS